MYVGILRCDVLLGDVRSLKQKRSVVRPIVADLAREYAASVAEVDSQDLLRRAGIGVAVVASTAQHASEVLDACERRLAARPEIDLLSARRRVHDDEDF